MTALSQNPGSLANMGGTPGLLTDMVCNDRLPTSNELEEVLTGWWRELLGLDHVAVDDDFFNLGGHSLTGVALFAKIKQTYGIELELSTLFEARTVVQLARVISCNLEAGRVCNGRPPTSNELEEVLTAWWQELLGLEHVAVDDDFFNLGGHSLTGVALFAKIKQSYGIELELSTLFEARTVVQLARVISCNLDASRTRARTWQSITSIQPNGARAPLFWVPGGYGTSLLAFREVSLLLGPDQPVYGFHAAMPEANQEMESIPDRAERFVKELRLFQPHGPYHLVGFCSGGFVAFEMAQQLMASGQTVGFLGLIECYDDRHPETWFRKVQSRVERTVWRVGQVLDLGPKGFGQWALRHIRTLAGRAVRMGAMPFGKLGVPLPPSEIEEYEKAHRSIRRYRPVAYPGKSVVLIGKDTYQFCGLSPSVDPRLVWCQLSRGGSEIKTIPGDHMDLLEGAIVHRLADALKQHLPGLPVD
jgi:thioesterase domain-containing protein/acyl carrier protein